MQGQTWSEFIIPYDGRRMRIGGCAITLAGNIAYTRNNATTVTPGTIVGNAANFDTRGNGMLWTVALNGTGVSYEARRDVDNGAEFQTAFNQYNASTTEYFIGIKVDYDGDPNHEHWVGATAIEPLDDGNLYVRISRTSTNDNATWQGTLRGDRGWRTDNDGNIYVPLNRVQGYVVYSRTDTINE